MDARCVNLIRDHGPALLAALDERDSLRALIADVQPEWRTLTKGRIWTADKAGQITAIGQRIDAAIDAARGKNE